MRRFQTHQATENRRSCHRAVNCYKNADCRGHDLHNSQKDCPIAPDSYRTPQSGDALPPSEAQGIIVK